MINPSSMARWQNHIGEDGIADHSAPGGLAGLLMVMLSTAITIGELLQNILNQVNIDTMVREKAIVYQVDAKL